MHIRSVQVLAAVLLPCALASGHTGHDPADAKDHGHSLYTGPGYRAARQSPGGGGTTAAATSLPSLESNNVTLLAWLPRSEFGFGGNPMNNCWGYTSPSGREYALVDANDGLAVVDLANPGDPQVVASFSIPGANRVTRVYGEYAYSEGESGDGIAVLDLTQVDSGTVVQLPFVTSGPGASASYDLVVDHEAGVLYRCGAGFFGGLGIPDGPGLRAYSLEDPASPEFLFALDLPRVRAAQLKKLTQGGNAGRTVLYCATGILQGNASQEVTLVEVLPGGGLQVLGATSWPNAEYSHSCALSEDEQFLFVTDERDEQFSDINTRVIVLDVSDLDNPTFIGSIDGPTGAIGHNVQVRGDLLYQASCANGLEVYELIDPANTPLVASFDTYPGSDKSTLKGTMDVYPFFESGVVILADYSLGLMVLDVGQPDLEFDFPNGMPEVASPAGVSFVVDLLEEQPGTLAPGSAAMIYDLGQGPIESPLVDLGGGAFQADLPGVDCGKGVEFYFRATSAVGVDWFAPGPGQSWSLVSAETTTEIETFDFESAAGWVSGALGDTATTGLWVRGDPIGALSQPEHDTSAFGEQCWFTGQEDPLTTSGNDVDDGVTTLLSPSFDLTGMEHPGFSYQRWYSNGLSTFTDDTFRVEVSADGIVWTLVEEVGPGDLGSTGGWSQRVFALEEFIEPGPAIQFRFIASDLGEPSLVDAAIDDFRVLELPCRSLVGDVETLSVAAGGTQVLALNAGYDSSGKTFLLLGSLSGTDPGIALPGLLLPLNLDAYLLKSVSAPNLPPFTNSLGVLDLAGSATSMVNIPGGLLPQLVGLTAHHAFVAIETSIPTVDFVSNAVGLDFLP